MNISVIFEGKTIYLTTSYETTQHVSSVWSNNFKAIWEHIILNFDNNNSIYKIKEMNENNNDTLFMVFQTEQFVFDTDIYARVEIKKMDMPESSNKSLSSQIYDNNIFTITLFSYKYSITHLKNMVEKNNDKLIYENKKMDILIFVSMK